MEMSELQMEGWEAFKRDLMGLLDTDPHKWVAYRGDSRVALRDSKLEVYQSLEEQQIPLTEVVVVRVEPLGPPVDLGRPRRAAGRREE